MQKARDHMKGLSLHYYTVTGWSGSKGSATDFTEDEYLWTLGKSLGIEPVIERHDSIMSAYDPDHKVALLVDEWGTWFDEEPGTISGHLYQQNTMRDAMVAALSLNVFHRHTDRVKMANIAQIANVLQAMVLTRGDKMVKTPTYYVFKMYIPHQNAIYLPLELKSTSLTEVNGVSLPQVNATASRKGDTVTITLANVDLREKAEVAIPLGDLKVASTAGEILTSDHIDDYNDFDNPDKVKLAPFKSFTLKGSTLKVTLPSKSIVSLTLTLK